jgi:hypothetical protein
MSAALLFGNLPASGHSVAATQLTQAAAAAAGACPDNGTTLE